MQHSFQDFLRNGGTGQYIVLLRNVAVYGGLAAPSTKAQVPEFSDMRDGFAPNWIAPSTITLECC